MSNLPKRMQTLSLPQRPHVYALQGGYNGQSQSVGWRPWGLRHGFLLILDTELFIFAGLNLEK